MEVTFSYFAKKNKFEERVERKKNLYRIFSLLIIIFDRKKKHHKDFLDSFVKFIIIFLIFSHQKYHSAKWAAKSSGSWKL